MRWFRTVAFGFAGFILIAAATLSSRSPLYPGAQVHDAEAAAPAKTLPPATPVHRVVIQISQDDPALMNIALNNAQNLQAYYAEQGQKVEIEFVAYGAGLAMVRSDISPVKNRLAEMSRGVHAITFSGCGNTLAKQSRQEKKKISLVSEARLVPSGVVRILELEERGWTYLRP